MKTKTLIFKVICLGLCIFTFLDVLFKIGLYDYKNGAYAFLTFGLELFIIIVIFYYNLISRALYGTLNINLNNKMRIIISFGSAFLISFVLFMIRMCLYFRLNEYGYVTWLLLGGVHIFIGGILNFSFYFASKKSNFIEKNSSEKEEIIWRKTEAIAFLLFFVDILIKIIVWLICEDASNYWHFSSLGNEVGYAFYLFGTESIIFILLGSMLFIKHTKKFIQKEY